MQKKTIHYHAKTEADLVSLPFTLMPGQKIAFVGDLWSGKTTLIRHLLRSYFGDNSLIIRSPTYTYYNSYTSSTPDLAPVYHFDLYRLEDRDTFFLIGGDDILAQKNAILLVEWPEIIGDIFVPTHTISLSHAADGGRDITIDAYIFPNES